MVAEGVFVCHPSMVLSCPCLHLTCSSVSDVLVCHRTIIPNAHALAQDFEKQVSIVMSFETVVRPVKTN